MWKQIPNFPAYEVSDDGQVRSWLPKNGVGSYKDTKEPRLLKQSTFSDSPYLRVSLKCPVKNKHLTRRVHQLVLEAFVGKRPAGFVVMHINDTPSDNRLSNLRYGAIKENAQDMVSKSRSCKGQKHPRSLCSDSLRKKIIDKALVSNYRGSRLDIAKELDVPINVVRRVIENYNLRANKEGKQNAKIKSNCV